ncbi:MAG: protein translocase subunit SecD [Bdellovibrionaceae bacterium]|nr:protein translocase subunit SecD [Pseudobdellovibrionaceae bacterium]
MMENLRIRWAIIFFVFVMSAIWSVPNFVNLQNQWWPTKAKMTKGLDIQGGSHLVYRVDTDSVLKSETERSSTSLQKQIQEADVKVTQIEVTDALVGGLRLTFADAGAREAGAKWLTENYGSNYQTLETTDTALLIRHPEVTLNQRRQSMVQQAIETIRNRIDEFGVAEPSITAQGTDRVLVQLPGIQDSAGAKELVNKTARLDFMIVETETNANTLRQWITDAETEGKFKLGEMKYSQYIDKLNSALKEKLPPNTIVYFEKDEAAKSIEVGSTPWLLKTNEAVGGDRLTDAFVTAGDFGQPVVAFRFDAEGTREFGDLTKRNEKKLMAIVLDKVVKSAPVIDEPITGGSGIIRLGGGLDPQKSFAEANLISLALRAGALPAPLEQLEERTVGPSLGAAAIERGVFAAEIACIFVFAFIILYYRSFGVVASLCLMFNVLIVIAVLSALRATLTLPGIAGLALTIGMAVDANVIIYERVKEELGKGASLIAAIREGYDRAFSSIFDANLTTALVCVILMYYGTGPIRGFAVTLICGLAASMFTSIYFTRAVFETLVGKWKMNLAVKWS